MPEPITDDQRDMVSEVREALAKATPPPWRAVSRYPGFEIRYMKQTNAGPVDCFLDDELRETLRFEDAHLIANAPEWLAALCEQVERLRWLVCSECGDGRGWISVPDPATGDEMQQRCEMCDWRARAEAAEAAVERVRALADEWSTTSYWAAATCVREALDGE